MRILMMSRYDLWHDYLPSDLRDPLATNHIGGGETAMMSISRELAALGHEIFVFTDSVHPANHEGVDYLPKSAFQSFATHLDHDVLVSWDLPAVFYSSALLRSKLNVLAFQLNDAAIGAADMVIDRYFHPSHWHARRFGELYPEINPQKQRPRLTNGIDPTRYQSRPKRNPYRVMYSSSPDRGLHHLLRIWPDVVKRVPQAELHVFYEVEEWLRKSEHFAPNPDRPWTYENCRRATLTRTAINEQLPGVHFRGPTSQWKLAQEQLASGIQAYPCDPLLPTEGFSMSCLEALVAGCQLLVTPTDALEELWIGRPGVRALPVPQSPTEDLLWVDALTDAMQRPKPQEVCAREFDEFDWARIAKSWESELLASIEEKSKRLGILFSPEYRHPGSGVPAPIRFGTAAKKWSFRGREFWFAHNDFQASWYTFQDESEIRNKYWDIQEGDVVLDVGASAGSYTLPALACGASPVFAWTPDYTRECLSKSLHLNGFQDRCEILTFGLYDRNGYLHPESQEFSERYQRGFIKVMRGDDFVESRNLEKVNWIKLDVEGAEVATLFGFERTIARFRPKIMVENHQFKDQSIENQVRSFMKDRGYQEIATEPYGSISHSVYHPL